MLAECSHLSTGERMRAGRSVLNPANMQGCGSEVDLFPAQIADLRRSQSMPKRKQHHEAIAGALPIPALAIDQLLDLTSGEMLPGAQLSPSVRVCRTLLAQTKPRPLVWLPRLSWDGRPNTLAPTS